MTIPDAGGAATTVSEAGLAARGGEPAGSDAAANSETTSGTIAFTSPDGVQTVSLGGHVLTGTPQTFSDATGSMTASYSYDAATGAGSIAYSYTLTDNTLTDPSNVSFAVAVTDKDGDSTPAGNLTIAIIDDAPVAHDDAASVAEGSSHAVNGNVLTVDLGHGIDGFGADGGRVFSIIVDGVTYTWDGQATISKSSGGALSGTAISVDTALGGHVDFNFASANGHAAGDWNYTAPAQLVNGTTENFSYVITDNDGDHASATLAVSVTAVNDAPVNAVPGAQTVAEDAVLVFGAGKLISVADTDANGGNEKITLSVQHGTLNLATEAGLTVTGDGTGQVVLTGDLAHLNAALNGLSYKGAQDFNGNDTLTITTNDQGNTGSGGAQSDTDTIALTVTAVNDAPVNTVPGAQTVAEDTALVFGAGKLISIADTDANGGNEKITLSVQHGTLNLTTEAGLTVTGDGTGQVVLTGDLAHLNAALNGLSYQGAQDFNGSDTLTITSNDQGSTGSGGAQSDTDTIALTVTAVNDAPVNTVPGAQSIDQNQSLVFSTGKVISVADIDANGGNEQVTLNVQHGTLNLSTEAGLTVTGEGTNQVVLTGDLAHLNAALNGLTYAPVNNFHGSDVLTITTNDQGNTGTDPGLTGTATSEQDVDTVAINVNGPNHAPVAETDGIYVSESTDIVVPIALLIANDSDADGDTLSITATGNLGIGGASIATHVNADGTITFMMPDLSGNPNGSFTYTLSDGHTSVTGMVKVHDLNINTSGDMSDGILMSNKSYQFADIDTGAGNDILTLGAGVDHFTGGKGADIFIISDSSHLNAGDSINGTAEAATIDTLTLDDVDPYDLTQFDITNINSLVFSSSVAGNFDVTVGDAMVSTADYNQDGLGGDLMISTNIPISLSTVIDASHLTGSNHILIDGENFNGNDTFSGGAGGDTLTGGQGSDILTGGGGADHFKYISTSDGGTITNQAGADHILDFNAAQGDVIDILGSAFGGLTAGANVAAIFGSSANDTFSSPTERFHYDTATHTLLYDSNGSASGGTQAALAVFDNHAIVAATNIHVV